MLHMMSIQVCLGQSLHLDPLFTADLSGAAMQDALEKDSRIHRDISVGNIVLVKEKGSAIRRGYLIDWETSCKVDDDGAATEVGRVVSLPGCRPLPFHS